MEIYFFLPEGRPDTVKIDIVGEIDGSTYTQFEKALIDHFQKADKKIFIYDFRRLTFINSKGIGLLIKLIKESKSLQKEIVFVEVHGQISEVIELVGLRDVVRIFPHIGEALRETNKSVLP